MNEKFKAIKDYFECNAINRMLKRHFKNRDLKGGNPYC